MQNKSSMRCNSTFSWLNVCAIVNKICFVDHSILLSMKTPGRLQYMRMGCNAQCSRCGQNLQCSIYRRIICSCSYCIQHLKILLYQLLEHIILHWQNPQYPPVSCYRSILSSFSYYQERILLKMAKLEFENHKN